MTMQLVADKGSLSETAAKWLEERGLDSSLCADKLGLTSFIARDGHEWLTIPYERDGQRVNRKFRQLEPKKFRQDPGGEQIFWRSECLTDAGLADQPLIITEGEFDAIAAIQAGFWRTVSIPSGAPSQQLEPDARDRSAKYAYVDAARAALEPIGEIIIAADMDGAGRALLADLTALLGAARCKFVLYPGGAKDLNDVLKRDGVEGVRAAILAARWVNVAGVYKLDELPPLPPLTIWRPQFHNFSELHDLIPLCPGHVSIWTGIPGMGKSTLLNACAWSIAKERKVCIAHGAFETTPQREYMQDLIAHMTGYTVGDRDMPDTAVDDVRDWAQEHIVFINGDGYAAPKSAELVDATLEWFLQAAQTAVVRHGCRFVILDPWSQIDHDMDRGEREDQYIRRALKRFKQFARTFDVHVAVVAHPTKPKRDGNGAYEIPEGYEISGASHWYNFADVGVTVHSDPEFDMDGNAKSAGDNCARVLVRVWKIKNHRMMNRPGDVHAIVNFQTGRYTRWIDPKNAPPHKTGAARGYNE